MASYTSPDQLGADQRKAYDNRDALTKQALDRGVSQQQINSFLANNPYDYQRLGVLSPATAGLAAAAPPPSDSTSAPSTAPATTPSTAGGPTGAPAMTSTGGGTAGLSSLGSAITGAAANSTDPTATNATASMDSVLRPNLSTRKYPQLQSALAGLMKAY